MIQTNLNPSRQVWIIDDDETSLLLAEAALAKSGFKVRTFSDAAQALDCVAGDPPDIVVVDVVMPGMDGFEFCSRLLALPAAANLPILMATSLDDPESINRAYEVGATDFTAKPINWTIETHRLRYMLRAADMARELRLKERETRLAKDDWEKTFNAIPDVVAVLDTDLRIVRANKAASRVFDGPDQSLVGCKACLLFHGAHQPCAHCPTSNASQKNQPMTAEVYSESLGATFEVTVSPMTDEAGQVTRFVHVARDLSEQKHLEAELRQAQKMEAVGTLAGGVAHDFNNILTVVSGFAELLKIELAANPKVFDMAQSIFLAARRGTGLARQLLLFSRKGKSETHKQAVTLSTLVQDLSKMLIRVLPKNVELQTRFEPGLRQVHADAGQLDQVLMNLSVNAGHAMSSGGKLVIETSNVRLGPDYCRLHPNVKAGDYVLLAVSDSGHGMDKATMERIYEPFFTTKKVGEGTGLGLSVVFGIVQNHDGYIACYSEVGVGTTFRIYLPAVGGVEAPPSPAPEGRPVESSGTETILVVDDEVLLRGLVEEHLSQSGYTVLAAADGELALQRFAAAAQRPQAVLLDLGMPKMSGWECLQKLRSLDPAVKVLVATGYGGDGVEARALELGACGFIRKPFDLTELSRKLRAMLEGAPGPQ